MTDATKGAARSARAVEPTLREMVLAAAERGWRSTVDIADQCRAPEPEVLPELDALHREGMLRRRQWAGALYWATTRLAGVPGSTGSS